MKRSSLKQHLVEEPVTNDITLHSKHHIRYFGLQSPKIMEISHYNEYGVSRVRDHTT